MIVSGGENVFPREVEDLLSEHEHVAEVAVIGVDDDEFGQRLKAFVVLKESGGDASEEDLKGHVKQNLARYKVPREIVFLEELPRNATGKVLKKDLRAQEEDGEKESEGGSEDTGEGSEDSGKGSEDSGKGSEDSGDGASEGTEAGATEDQEATA